MPTKSTSKAGIFCGGSQGVGCKPHSLLQNIGAYVKIFLSKWTRARHTVLKSGITLLNTMARFAWTTTHALWSKYHSLHHRWKVPWATPSSLAAALPEISPLRHAVMTDSYFSPRSLNFRPKWTPFALAAAIPSACR